MSDKPLMAAEDAPRPVESSAAAVDDTPARGRSAAPAVGGRLMPTSSRQLRQQGRVYLHHLGWLCGDLIRRFPLRVCFVTGLHVIGVSAGAATIGLTIGYTRHLDAGTPLEVGPVSLPVAGGWMALLMGVVIGSLGLAAAACVYVAEWRIAKLTVAYQRECERRLFQIAADPDCRGWAALLPGGAAGQLTHLGGSTCRAIGMCMRRIMRGVLPLVMLVVAAVALVMTDWMMTLLLAPLGLIYAVPLYLINRGATRGQRQYKHFSPPVRKALRQAMQQAVDTRVPAEQRRTAGEAALDDPSYFRVGMLFFRRRLLVTQTQFLNTSFFVVTVMTLFTYAAISSGGPGWSWSRLLVYLLALRFVVGGLQRVTGTLVKLSRFLPEYRSYIQFVQAAAVLKREAVASRSRAALPEAGLTVRCGRAMKAAGDGPPRLNVERPGPLWVLLPWEPIEADLEAVAVRLERLCAEATGLVTLARFHAAGDDDPTRAVAMLRGDDEGDEAARLREAYAQLGVLDELQAWATASSGDERLRLGQLSSEAAWALGAAEVLLEPAPMVVLAAQPLVGLDAAFVQRLAGMLADRYVVLVADDPGPALSEPMNAWCPASARVLVLGQDRPLGGGDLAWLGEREADVRRQLDEQRPAEEAGDDLDSDED